MFNLMPKDEKFYDELERIATHVADSAQHLAGIVQKYPHAEEEMEAIRREDKSADALAQIALERLDRAFITPLDREDILHLITDLYTVVETINAAARRLIYYKLDAVDGPLAEQIRILAESAGSVRRVMERLREDHRLQTLNGELKKLHELERQADDRRNDFLRELFAGTPEPLTVMKKKELHDLIETALSNCENVSRTLQRVVLKNN